ncbi:MAG: hypothetical protein U0790_29075 [Isosphaeraceae bacterium]
MKLAPRLLLAMLAILGTAGCRTAGTNSIAHSRPPQLQPRSAFDLDAFVAEHNANASLIRSVEARPSIVVKISPPGERAREGKVDGRLALEQPRNFKLDLSSYGSTVADIGSNDERFWFWFSNKKDRSVYVCNYEDLGATTLAATYQPDWIGEALGLRQITPDEAAQVKVRPGPLPGTTALSFPATRAGGQGYSRLMIVSDQNRKVSEFRVFAPDGKTQLAQANIPRYQEYPVTPGEKSTEERPDVCYLPQSVTLEWTRERLTLNVALRDVHVNEFDPARRTALFVEPSPDGYARVNGAEIARLQESQGQTAIRETMPPPEPGRRARANPALQIREPKAAATQGRPSKPASAPGGELLLPVLDLEVVGAPVPTAPGASQGGNFAGLAGTPAMSLER